MGSRPFLSRLTLIAHSVQPWKNEKEEKNVIRYYCRYQSSKVRTLGSAATRKTIKCKTYTAACSYEYA